MLASWTCGISEGFRTRISIVAALFPDYSKIGKGCVLESWFAKSLVVGHRRRGVGMMDLKLWEFRGVFLEDEFELRLKMWLVIKFLALYSANQMSASTYSLTQGSLLLSTTILTSLDSIRSYALVLGKGITLLGFILYSI